MPAEYVLFVPGIIAFSTSRQAFARLCVAGAADETYMGVQDIAVLVGSSRIGLPVALAVSFWMAPGKRKPFGQLRAGFQACTARFTSDIGVATL
jgi:hypothetical protein